MRAKQCKKFILLGCQLSLLVADWQELLLSIECKLTDMIQCWFLIFLTTNTAKNCLYTEHKFFHRERLSDVIISTQLETFQDILFQCLCSQEDNWNLCISLTNILCQGKTILLWHHHVKDCYIKFGLRELLITSFTIRAKYSIVILSLQVLAKQHTQILVVFTEKNLYFLFHILYLLIVNILNLLSIFSNHEWQAT